LVEGEYSQTFMRSPATQIVVLHLKLPGYGE
jgi:hypothetical protein